MLKLSICNSFGSIHLSYFAIPNWCKLFPQFSSVEDFNYANLLAGELLDAYITGGIRLAWMMVTRIPPMIAIEPTAFDPHRTILESHTDSEVAPHQIISIRPILYFSYEGEVAVEGIVTTLCSSNGLRRKDSVNHGNYRDADDFNCMHVTVNIQCKFLCFCTCS